jgi:hypothetical protein
LLYRTTPTGVTPSAFAQQQVPAQAAAPRKESQREGEIDAAGKFTRVADSKPALTREAAEAEMRKTLQFRELESNSYAIGLVTFDKSRRTVRFPATMNLREEVIEYALVASTGKAHEALFVTDAKPEQLHLACLLLGVQGAEMQGTLEEAATFPAENAVRVTVSWKKNGPDAVHDLAELITVRAGGAARPLAAGAWCYAGSRFNAMGFVAAHEGSFISLISDSAALLDNPRAERGHDDYHFPNTALLPAKGTPVEFTLRLPPQ